MQAASDNGATIVALSIHDFLGIQELELSPGKVNIARGRNGSGKSSILKAIEVAFGGKLPAQPIRIGADKAEILVKLNTMSIRKAITPRSGRLDVKDASGAVIGSPQSVLDRLYRATQFNPVAFVTAKPADRKKQLMAAMNLTVSEDLLKSWLGDFVLEDEAVPQLTSNPDALTVLENLRKHFYARRRSANLDRQQKEKTLTELEARIPADFEAASGDISAEYEKLRALEARRVERAKVRSDIAVLGQREQEVKNQISQLEEQLSKARHSLQKIEADAVQLTEEYDDLNDPSEEIATVNTQIARLKGNEEIGDLCKTREALRGELDAQTQTWEKLEAVVNHLQTQALDELMATSQLPVEGLEIVGDSIMVNGLPIEQLATSEQIKIALAVCRALAGSLRVICIDGIERLDTDGFNAFMEAAADDDFQYIVTQVADRDLEVEVAV